MKTINEKLAGTTSERNKAIESMSFEEAKLIIANRLKYPDSSTYNHTIDVFEKAIDVIYEGNDGDKKTQSNKSATTQKAGKEKEVSAK